MLLAFLDTYVFGVMQPFVAGYQAYCASSHVHTTRFTNYTNYWYSSSVRDKPWLRQLTQNCLKHAGLASFMINRRLNEWKGCKIDSKISSSHFSPSSHPTTTLKAWSTKNIINERHVKSHQLMMRDPLVIEDNFQLDQVVLTSATILLIAQSHKTDDTKTNDF